MNVSAKDGNAVVACGDVLVSLWLAPVSMPLWKWHFTQLEHHVQRHPEGALSCDLILPSASPPDAAVRAVLQSDLRRLGPQLRKLIAVPLGDGVWISVVRTIVRGTLIVSGQSKRAVVVGTVDEALTLLGELAGPATPASAVLRNAVAALFQSLGVKQNSA
jgi:hypothetical protein